MDQIFRDYKDQEGKKIIQIIHACTAISSAALISEGATSGSGFLVLAILSNGLTYAYWFFTDVAIYGMNLMSFTNAKQHSELREMRSQKKPQEEIDKLCLKVDWSYEQHNNWKKLHFWLQIKCFSLFVFSWISAIVGLVALYVSDASFVLSGIMVWAIGLMATIGVIITIWDYCKIIKQSRKEEPS